MLLLEQIKIRQLEARKARDDVGRGCLTALLSDIQMLGKNASPPRETTEEESIRVVKKHLDTLIENRELFRGRVNETTCAGHLTGDAATRNEYEIGVLMSLLPKQLTDDELRANIKGYIEGLDQPVNGKLVGPVMKHLREQYLGRFDGSNANKILKELIDNV